MRASNGAPNKVEEVNKISGPRLPFRLVRATPYRVLWLAAATALLTGCASPIMHIKVSGYSVAQSPVPSAAPQNMGEAVAKLEYFRATYYEAIVNRAQTQQNTTTGLVWLGTAVAAMAAGTVHRDAILGVTLIGGTSYGLSSTQLDARHVQVWNQGIKALNCAKNAALPMDIGSRRHADLEDAITQLSAQRATVAGLRVQTAATATLVKVNNVPLATEAFELLAKVDEIRSCRRIVSTSFHGLVIPEAFGIPNMWFSTHPGGAMMTDVADLSIPMDHRVRDWYSGTSLRRVPIFGTQRHLPTRWDQVIRWLDNAWEPLQTNAAGLFDAFPLRKSVDFDTSFWPLDPALFNEACY